MTTPGTLLRRFGRAVSSRNRRRILILLYHRIAEVAVDPWLLAVTPEHFRQHLACLRSEGFTILKPTELADAPDLSVVVTFDDGYSDNYTSAAPLLQAYEAPATFFVVTSMIQSDEEYWWDALERIFLHPGTLPPSLTLTVDLIEKCWNLRSEEVYTTADWSRYRVWRAWESAPTPRQELYLSVYNFLFGLRPEQRSRCMAALRAWAGISDDARPQNRCLNCRELQNLAASNLFLIGSHTATHPALSALPLESQQVELQSSKRILEDCLNRPITVFSYPFGRRKDYNQETIQMLKQGGFTCACANFFGVVRNETDPYQLPRNHVENWDGDQFGHHLRNWLSISN